MPSLFYGELVTTNRIIYTPSDFAKKNLLYLQEVGELTVQRPHISSRQNLSSYLFFTVLSGSGTLTYGGVTYNLKKGDCGFIDCKKPYSHQSSKDFWSLKWIHFFGANMNGIYKKYIEHGGKCTFSPNNFELFSNIITSVFNISSSSSYIRDMEIFEKLSNFLTELMRESWNADSSENISVKRQDLTNIKDFLDEHYKESIKLDKIADSFFINKFYLSHIFKEQFGMTINGYLQQLRITYAKRHLRFTDWSIEKIGEECGYPDMNYFIRIFKKTEGMSPGIFRKKWRS